MSRKNSDRVIQDISLVFREYIDDANSLTSENSYKSALTKLEGIDFVASDVSNFAGMISRDLFTDKANYWTVGLFISAAINKIIKKADIVTLDFSGMDSPVDCIGYRLEHGNIVLQENAGDYLGERMFGGKITIDGNAGNYVGYAMSGGEIKIKGNAGSLVGRYMTGGTISIEGQIGSISEECKGKIYRGGSLVR